MTITEAATQLGVTNHVIRRLIKDQNLAAEQLRISKVIRGAEALRHPPRVVLTTSWTRSVVYPKVCWADA